MNVLGLRTVIYHVSDLQRAKAWYSAAFGVQPYFDEPFYVGFNIGGFELGLDPNPKGVKPGPGGSVAYWGVKNAEEGVAHFTGSGATLTSAIQDVGEGIRVATVADPFGNLIGLIENPHFAAAYGGAMTRRSALAFVKRQGIVLESARGPVPNLAEAVVGGRIRGSWWGHAKGKQIFWLTRAVRDSSDVLVCRLVGGKITYVHRRLWPALVRLARRYRRQDLAAVREVHTARGEHKEVRVAFPGWVPPSVKRAARRLGLAEAQASMQLSDES